jgi:molybdate transport system substrate-binding protein
MTRTSFGLWAAIISMLGLLCSHVAQAAELKVLTSMALTSVLDELKPSFEKATGHKLNIGYDLIAAHRKSILDGEAADVIILSRAPMEELLKQGKVSTGADPAKGGASGVYFARVLDRLDIAEQMKPKTILVPGAQAAEVVAKGEAELGVAQGSEIVPVPGAYAI